MTNKPLKVEFAPGCFDDFEGTQEELDKLVEEIQSMFANKSREEIESMSQPLDEDSWDELPDEAKEQIARSILEEFGDEEDTPKRKLQ